MSKKCPACGSHVVRPSHFRGHTEREVNSVRSPYRCVACGARFLVLSHGTRQAIIGVIVFVCVVVVAVGWPLLAGVGTKPVNFSDTSALPKSSSSSGAPEVATLAEIAKESRCTDRPVNVTGATYKCTTPSGLTSYFVVPEAKPSARKP